MDEYECGMQPLKDTVTGCVLAFIPISPMYQPMSALAILTGLNAKRFTGTCECYIQPGIQDGECLMGIGLQFAGEMPPDKWWGEFVGNISYACEDDEDIHLPRDGYKLVTVGELRAAMLHAGTAGFEAGSAVWVSDPAGPDPDSPFTWLCRNIQ